MSNMCTTMFFFPSVVQCVEFMGMYWQKQNVILQSNGYRQLCEHYEQPEVGKDFVNNYEKIGATNMFMDAKLPINFLL